VSFRYGREKQDVEATGNYRTCWLKVSEAIKEAGLIALGRSIHLPNRACSILKRDLPGVHQSHKFIHRK
jgi:hypothetical protein